MKTVKYGDINKLRKEKEDREKKHNSKLMLAEFDLETVDRMSLDELKAVVKILIGANK